jgi:hypothetical protein
MELNDSRKMIIVNVVLQSIFIKYFADKKQDVSLIASRKNKSLNYKTYKTKIFRCFVRRAKNFV